MPDDEARIAQFMTERASPTFKISRINGTGTVWDARAEFSRVGSNFKNALTHALHAQLGANKILFVPCELRDHNTDTIKLTPALLHRPSLLVRSTTAVCSTCSRT